MPTASGVASVETVSAIPPPRPLAWVGAPSDSPTMSSLPSSTCPEQAESSAAMLKTIADRMRASLRRVGARSTHIANRENDFLHRLSIIDYNMLNIAPWLMRPNEGTAAGETQIFIGRADERARLDALVEARRIVAVVGASGIGKSAL